MKNSGKRDAAETPGHASGGDFGSTGLGRATDSPNVRDAAESLLLRPKEAAAMLAISPRKLWELTNMREVPCVRIGRCLRYPREALRGWVASRQGRQA